MSKRKSRDSVKYTFEQINELYQNGKLIECENCSTTGIKQEVDTCPYCNGLGFVEKESEADQ